MPIVHYSWRGTSNYRKKHMGQIQGHYSIFNKFTGEIAGKYATIDVYEKYTGEIKGHYAILRKYTGEIKGRSRSAQDAVDQYELFRGVDEMPDFDAAAWETFTTFPHETAALDADHVYYFVLRKRNKYGIISQNTTPTIITIDAGGDQITNAPSNASDIKLKEVYELSMNISAIYNGRQDDNPADTWLIYLAEDFTDPDPDVDIPIEVPMKFQGGESWLDYDYGPRVINTNIRVIIRTRVSGSPDADSDDETIYEDEITGNVPGAVDADVFSDDIYAHAQGNSISAIGLNFEMDDDAAADVWAGNELTTNDGDLTQAKLAEYNDILGSFLDTRIWTATGVTENSKWVFTGPGGGQSTMEGMASAAGPTYNMFQFIDQRFKINIPTGAPPSQILIQLWWHAQLTMTLQWFDSAPDYLAWNINDVGGSGTTNGTITPFVNKSFGIRLKRLSTNVATIEYRPDVQNTHLDTGWTVAGTATISGTQVALKTGRIKITGTGIGKIFEVLDVFHKTGITDILYPPEQMDPIVYLRDGLDNGWAAFDESGVSVSNVEMTETIPTDCEIHYVYTSLNTSTRPNKATMIALSHYTSFATFKTALEADAGLLKYLYIGVLLYAPSVTAQANLNDATPIISAPVLDY